jgi:hypothetical protein
MRRDWLMAIGMSAAVAAASAQDVRAQAAQAPTTAPAAAPASSENPLSRDVVAAYGTIKNNLVKMAEQMPEEHYGFKPSPDIRSFGELVGHVADAQTSYCSLAGGEARKPSAAGKTAKADLVAALTESFTFCDTIFGAVTDATGLQAIKTPRGEITKLGLLNRNVTHSNEEYGYMAVYLRIKGVVPPSSQR